ncbi:MAG: hypothetical protein FWJ90_21040 [Actinomadura sp.]
MTLDDTSPDLMPPIRPEPERRGGSVLRPLERRVLQAVALLCAVAALLTLHWLDEANNVEKNLKPPEKVVTVPPGGIGEFMGAKWKVMKRETARPLAGGAAQGTPQGDVVELRFWVGVRPEDAASAKAVGAYDVVYRFVDGEGREWSAMNAAGGREFQAGVPALINLKGTVPRAKADSLELEIRAPRTYRKPGKPLLSLRFEQ